MEDSATKEEPMSCLFKRQVVPKVDNDTRGFQ